MKKIDRLVMYPAFALMFIAVRLGATEFTITAKSYFWLVVSILFPFVLFYLVECYAFWKEKDESLKVNLKTLCISLFIFLLSSISLFFVYIAKYPIIHIE